MIKSVLITGANAGLGRETARQLAAQPHIEKIYLGCRNTAKAQAAKVALEQQCGRAIFEVLKIDVSDLHSVSAAVSALPQAVDALLMNAGGTGGQQFYKTDCSPGVTRIFGVNLLGHAHLAQSLLQAGKLRQVAIYAGSEAARGVPEMRMQRPVFNASSKAEFTALARGEIFHTGTDATEAYGPIKYMAALWMSSLARDYPSIRFVTMSPGATTGTQGFDTLPWLRQYAMKTVMRFMLVLGKVHKLEVGAKRFVDALLDQRYLSGTFYASENGLTGTLCAQEKLFADLADMKFQDSAKAAIEDLLAQHEEATKDAA